MYATNTVFEELKFCDILISSAEQHVDARDSRVKRDNIDVTS